MFKIHGYSGPCPKPPLPRATSADVSDNDAGAASERDSYLLRAQRGKGLTMKYYDEGWNARCRGEPYQPTASLDWRDGWKDADEAPEEHRKEMD